MVSEKSIVGHGTQEKPQEKEAAARKSQNRRVSRAARLAILQEEPVSMKTDADEFDQDAIECGIRLSLLEQQSSHQVTLLARGKNRKTN